MSRLPFNPDHVVPPEPDKRKRNDEPISVTQLSNQVKQVITDAMPAKVRVIGQVSNLSNRQHWFFSLKDDGAAIRCVCFASSARRIRFPVEDGMEVIATGRVDYYPAQGQLQLYVDKLEPVGQGALDARFKALCAQLRELGYFDEASKKALPFMPDRIAVITSRTAAALQDVRDTAARRWPGVALVLQDVRVQGEAAAGQIAAAIDAVSQHGQSLGIGAIILTRGGGSVEDLWAFNERPVADAVYNCRLPIVAAIGHETDTTIAELVADMRCATPTAAATVLVPEAAMLRQQVDQLSARLSGRVRRELQHHKQRLDAAARHRMFRQPLRMLEPVRERVESMGKRLAAAMQRRLAHDNQRLTGADRQLQTIGPRNVMARGYSITLDATGSILRHAAEAKPGDALTTVLSDGKVTSRVAGASPRKRSKDKDDAPTLFGA